MNDTTPAIWYGGDYNPEQWPEEIWDEDVRLMQQGGISLVSLGIFSWAKLEPREGDFDFAWLDRIMAKLHEGGVRIDLATATASPPPWLSHAYPEVLPVTETGVRLQLGSRQQYCPSSPVFRRLAARLVQKIAERYSDHPGLELWHIGNEYGCHVSHCYCEVSAEAFRGWLRARYGTVEAVNAAWGTAFWSQNYGTFDEIHPPSAAPTFRNPGQLLDFDRFSSDELLECYRTELAVLRAATPAVPITTNFMGLFGAADYWKWAQEVDVVSDDSYPDPADPESPAYAAMTRDLMRSLRGGQPWLLMEQAPSAVNWRRRNAPKRPGQMRAWSLQAVARGADGILFFQWRQSVSGAEKFHSGLVPHAGTDTRVWREVEALGAELKSLSSIAGSRVEARVAIVMEWDSWWSLNQDALPAHLSYVQSIYSWYRELWARTVTVDFVRATSDLSGYAVVVVPTLFTASAAALGNLAAFAEAGGHLVVGYQSGITDETTRITAGGYLGALQETLGVRVEEFAPFATADLAASAPASVELPTGVLVGLASGETPATVWAEYLHATDAEVVATFGHGDLAGWPAITRRATASGAAWYVATQPVGSGMDDLLDRVLGDAGVTGVLAAPVAGVEAVRRGGRLFLINHGDTTVAVEGITVEPRGVHIGEA
ncbi:beta-galactosidase [Galbitalea soli]|uniref:Beta-galactosidase n=1 Tax=Galbitalea soli TaxID=1268042 RepID=A0A7C9PQ40_9MICO|nr:beta-galactosidase [Galbitalea soli]NEM92489.1 beta-galactosidase [Galbitalea soli]NYJ29525.1 beta-galactosidase [Galbitalea soli]